MAGSFLDNPENKKTTNHIDSIKTNNFYLNLEKATHSENNKHAFDTGLRIGSCTGKFGKDHHLSMPIVKLTINGTLVSEYEGIMDAHRQTGLDASGIAKCCKGKYKTVGGNIWEYKSDYNGRN